MSAQLAGSAIGAPSNNFSASLVLAAGVTAYINAPTMHDLAAVVGKLQPTEAVNDPMANKSVKDVVGNGATAPAGSPAGTTAAASAPTAAAAGAGDKGNAGAPAPTGASSAPTASTQQPSGTAATAGNGDLPADPKEAFDVLKKAFLALSQKKDGRTLCEGVLATVEPKLGKLSEAKPEQYAGLLAAIKKASE